MYNNLWLFLLIWELWKECKGNRAVPENGKHEVKFMFIKKMLAPSLMAAALLTLSPVISPPGPLIYTHTHTTNCP